MTIYIADTFTGSGLMTAHVADSKVSSIPLWTISPGKSLATLDGVGTVGCTNPAFSYGIRILPSPPTIPIPCVYSLGVKFPLGPATGSTESLSVGGRHAGSSFGFSILQSAVGVIRVATDNWRFTSTSGTPAVTFTVVTTPVSAGTVLDFTFSVVSAASTGVNSIGTLACGSDASSGTGGLDSGPDFIDVVLLGNMRLDYFAIADTAWAPVGLILVPWWRGYNLTIET